jgi:hypothetical protein
MNDEADELLAAVLAALSVYFVYYVAKNIYRAVKHIARRCAT